MALYGGKLLKEASIEAEDIQNVDLKPYVELMAYDDIRRCENAFDKNLTLIFYKNCYETMDRRNLPQLVRALVKHLHLSSYSW